ncbi:hypothetical protein EJV46_10200 [Roseococcus sp. SYP-B2431]|nr:hypothetical protein EJV46_10200 [Roseococcus sp. SYP-B2431]
MTRKKVTHSPSDRAPAQVERFAEAARALGADESEAAFREKLAAIARHKPEGEPKAKKGE